MATKNNNGPKRIYVAQEFTEGFDCWCTLERMGPTDREFINGVKLRDRLIQVIKTNMVFDNEYSKIRRETAQSILTFIEEGK